jgi:Uma2 family endonuclease
MATVQALPAAEMRYLLHDISWRFYEQFLAEIGDRPIRLTYDRGSLELMSPSFEHETAGAVLGRLIGVLAEELNLRVKAGKSTTFRREDLERGLEPDECYYTANVPLILGRTEIDLTHDPPPDLAIEVDITRSSLDRMGIYVALGVPEVWRYDGSTLEVHVLQPGGGYARRERSLSFPQVDPTVLPEFVHRGIHTDDTTLVREFRAWVRATILPHHAAGDPAAPPE